jgi:O-antigen/teichoic acid export membrane protein
MLKHDVTATFISNVFAAIFSLCNAVILARVLGPADRGLLGLAMLIPTVIATFCILGHDMVNVTFAGLYKDKRSSLFEQSLIITLFGTLVSTLVIYGFFFLLPVNKGEFGKLSSEIIWLTCIISPLLMLGTMSIALVRGIGRITTAAGIHFIQLAVLTGLLAIFLIWCGFGLRTVVVLMAANYLVGIALSFWVLRDYVTLRLSKFSGWMFKKSLGFGAQISLTTFAGFLIYRIDQGMLAYMVPAGQLGLYVVAVSLAEQLRLLPNSIATAFLPRLANDLANRQSQVPAVFRYATIISTVSMLLVAIIGSPAILIIFGKDYYAMLPSFLLLLPGIAALGGASILAGDLASRQKPKYGILISCVILVATVVLNLALIPFIGIAGAALVSSISYIAACILWLICYRRESKVSIKEMIPRWEDCVYLFNVCVGILKHFWQRCLTRLCAGPERNKETD